MRRPLPLRRDIHFNLPPELVTGWHADGKPASLFAAALQSVFPAGERFFIESVRAYRDRITDPELKKAVTAFIGQEAMHGREHEAWNAAFVQCVPGTRRFERFSARLLARWTKSLPNSLCLSATIGAEHVTAIIGDYVLRHPEFIEGSGADKSHPAYVAVLRWHAMEETEHKAVAFDVWKAVMRPTPFRYVERCAGILLMLGVYFPLIDATLKQALREDNDGVTAENMALLRHRLYGKDGLLRTIAPAFLRYFKPGFHPWQHDNHALLEEMDGLIGAYALSNVA